MNDRSDPLDALLESLSAAVERDPLFGREFRASRTEFFSGRIDPRRYDEDALARRRHLEWFLLERVAPAVDGLVVEHLAERPGSAIGPAELATFRNSLVGVFEVTGVRAGDGLWLRDLTSGGEYPVREPDASNVVQAGDLIAGRIFPLGDGAHVLSRAAAFYRNETLREALRNDLARARARTRGVLRIRQRDLEGMFFAADLSAPSTDPVGDARTLLLQSGIAAEEIDGWLEDLAGVPFPRERLVVGADDALGPILDRLAFESGVDLDGARRALLSAWEHVSSHGPGSGPSVKPAPRPRGSSSRVDVAQALAAFDAKRREGAPLDDVLAELEHDLALDEDDDGDPDLEAEAAPAPDFPGVVGAMVTEFLWETGATAGPERAAEFARLESFGRFAHAIGVFENLSARDLVTYAAWWLPENGALRSADEARAQLSALAAFCRWADENHETQLSEPFAPSLQGLSSSLPRVVEGNRRRTRPTDPSQGELFELRTVDGERVDVRDRHGAEFTTRVDGELTAWLRAGDRVRAQRHDDGRLAIYCCYPPEVAALETPTRRLEDGASEDDE